MIRRSSVRSATAALMMAWFAQVTVADSDELPVEARVLDPDISLHEVPKLVISPDSEWIAYVSKGYVSACNVRDPAPLRLFEVPDSWTHRLARPEYAFAREDAGALYRTLGQKRYQELRAEITSTVYGLRWTCDGDGIVFGVQSYDKEMKNSTYINRLVSLKGTVTTLSHVGPDALTVAMGDGILTRDRKFLIAQGHKRSLIWDVSTNKPRATCFSNLTPSSTSGNWIGIEKDTKQLVITDEHFDVVKRFDEFQPSRTFGFDLAWSPNERFVILRNQVGFDHYSNWEGFRMNLDTGEKREISGHFINERLGFTGNGGEFWRCGMAGEKAARWSGNVVLDAHLTIVPDGNREARDVWRLEIDPDNRYISNHSMFPPLRPDSRCQMFALGIPELSDKRPIWTWHVIDRAGNKWRFPGDSKTALVSPYDVVGFCDNDTRIIAHDDNRLFILPVSSIKQPENKVQ